jgi:hypothetical protein
MMNEAGSTKGREVRFWHLADIDLDPVDVRFRG